MKLFWVSTSDRFEDWFVVADDERYAQAFHEDAEGFEPGSATAKFLVNVSSELIEKHAIEEASWPSHELLEDLGCTIVSSENPRKVNFRGKIYREGCFTEGFFFDEIGRQEGVYVIMVQGTEKYKIGITVDIKKRVKQFETGNPENLKLVYFVATEHYKSLEKHLHDLFAADRIGGEWFVFDEEKLRILEANLALLQEKASSDFTVFDLKLVSSKGRVY